MEDPTSIEALDNLYQGVCQGPGGSPVIRSRVLRGQPHDGPHQLGKSGGQQETAVTATARFMLDTRAKT